MVGWTGRSGRCRAHDLHETVHILYVYGLNFEYIRLHYFASDHHSIEKKGIGMAFASFFLFLGRHNATAQTVLRAEHEADCH